jgi:hypothetical protein
MPESKDSPTEWSEPEIVDSKLSLSKQVAINEQQTRLLRRLLTTQNLVLPLLVGAIAVLLASMEDQCLLFCFSDWATTGLNFTARSPSLRCF